MINQQFPLLVSFKNILLAFDNYYLREDFMLPKILHLLIDHNNLGVLYVSPDQSIINLLKEGFLEGSNRLIFPSMALDGTVDKTTFITEKELISKHVAWTNDNKLVPLNQEYITSDFLENKRLAGIRAPFITKISQRVYTILKDKTINMPLGHSFDSALQAAISGSDVTSHHYHRDIIEMARIRGWSPEEAYKDLKMRLESNNSFKVKIYGLTMKFASLANQCTTKEELSEIEKEYDIITTKNQRI